MKNIYGCEKCEEVYDDPKECSEHEAGCGKPEILNCYKCGHSEDVVDDEYGWKKEAWSHINLGRPGYGSSFDGCDVEFTLCDKCLQEIVNSFTDEGQEKVYNSGCNQYLTTEKWIERHLARKEEK